MYDAIVVGARCAGSPTAMLLARKGYRVLLLDRAAFPSDTVSTHIVWQRGMAQLKRWGLHDALAASGCPPLRRINFDFGPVSIKAESPAVDGAKDVYCPRRTVLDKILVDAAVRAGAELREHFTVDELTFDDGAVTGIRGHARGGAPVAAQARIVVGADGMHSIVARAVSALLYNEKPALTCFYYSYWSDLATDEWEGFARAGQVVGSFPTHDGRTLVLVGWPAERFHEVRADIEGSFHRALAQKPDFGDRVRSATQAERFAGTADLPNFFRKPHGPGWALVGDAGYHKDPITAQGISDAFCDATMLADAIDDGLSGSRPLDDALAAYEQRRNQERGGIYAFTCQFAALEALPPDQVQLIAALQHNLAQMQRFAGVFTGAVPVHEFFAPENLASIMASASA